VCAQQFANATHVGSTQEDNGITLFQIFEHSLIKDFVAMVNDGVMATGKQKPF